MNHFVQVYVKTVDVPMRIQRALLPSLGPQLRRDDLQTPQERGKGRERTGVPGRVGRRPQAHIPPRGLCRARTLERDLNRDALPPAQASAAFVAGAHGFGVWGQ